MTSEKRVQKFHTDDVSLPWSGLGLGCALDWLKEITLASRLIGSTDKIWEVKRHQYGISVLLPQTSFRGETIGGVQNFGCFLGLLKEPVVVFCPYVGL